MEDIISEIGSTPALQAVSADDAVLDSIIRPPSSSSLQQQQHDQQQQQSLDQNSQQQQTQRSAPEKDQSKKSAKEHACGFCGVVFPSYALMVEHRAKHGGDRPYQCHVCDKRFTQKAHLIIHRRTHTGEKPYACHICHKRFAQSSHLNSHKRVHTGEKPFFCSICNMGFCRRQRLEAHLQLHAPEVDSLVKANQPETAPAAAGTTKFSSAEDNTDNFPLLPGFDINKLREEVETAVSRTNPVSQQAVFPGFSSSGTNEAVDNFLGVSVKQEIIQDEAGDEGGEGTLQGGGRGASRSPTPSSQSSTSTTPKSRRKPAFVRRLGADGGRSPVKMPKNLEDEALSMQEEGTESTREETSQDSKTEPSSAQEAAVHALMRMATSTESDDVSAAEFDANMHSILLKQTLLLAEKSSTSESSNSRRGNSTGNSGAAGSHRQQKSSRKFVSPESSPIGGGGGLRTPSSRQATPTCAIPSSSSGTVLSSLIRTNNRISLVDFTAEDLLRHMMSRDDVYRCDFCRIIFHDAALYHLHRSMHDKMDIRCCNLCGKLALDKYDFTAHFLSQHK